MDLLKINNRQIATPSSFKYTLSDFDLESGRNINGEMVRNRVTTKVRLDLTWKSGAMDTKSMSVLLKAFDDVFFDVSYFDIREGQMVTKKMYVSDRTGNMYSFVDGKPVFDEISFALIEK